MTKTQMLRYAKAFGIWFAGPALFYLVFFFIFNPDHLRYFSQSFYLDRGDGMQNIWNMWWVNFALTDLGQSPYYTHFLQFPHGITLIPQTMSIFNGLVGIPLMAAGLNVGQALNVMVIFSFVMGGVTMFWLVRHLTKSYWAGILAGFMFTFSSYHFAHAVGHMQLISLEWVPLFLLAWLKLLEHVRYRYAAMAAGALLLVILCDYYYFIYCAVAALIIAAFYWRIKKLKLTRQNLKVLAAFGVMALLTSGIFIIALAYTNYKDPLLGAHDAKIFSLDALALFIPGEQWYWYPLTEWYHGRIPGFHAETDAYLGVALVSLAAVSFFARKRLKIPQTAYVWWIIMGAFLIMSIGPRLRVFGNSIDSIPMPYAFLERLVPTLQVSGMPVRMAFMVQLAAVILAGYVVSKIPLSRAKPWGIVLLVGIFVVATIDVYPRLLPLSRIDSQEPYAEKLKELPLAKGSGIIDNAAYTPYEALYAQTLHQKPMAFGYMTRTPTSVEAKSLQIFADVEEKRFDKLCSVHKIRYVATTKKFDTTYPIIYTEPGGRVRIYDFRRGDDC